MPNVKFILPDGREQALEVENGTSLMRAATWAGIHSIVGDCGGNLACATCHVYVESTHAELLGPADTRETEMLEYTAAPRLPNSRLSCQILMQEGLEGLTVRVADPQL
ncbi:2Fe-2S iron-sulfur cluster-binding protein [Variovorax sp. KK3]|uniref:2Fe-2S iron-sulfur cluster-binding protein n=1 Tax=Variovorax sp. KK3 TaxID=1855728 RepID=UPI00097C247E|nr:2Fe-2S iron-sulfur cluster-binding protein [Variovorax sp. KK3]